MKDLSAIVMAAGHGTRMKSEVPKVVHPACGRPLVYYPVRAALDLGAAQVVVVVNPATHKEVEAALDKHLPSTNLVYAVQEVPRGTGDAVRAGMKQVHGNSRVLVLSGDTPLLRAADIEPLVKSCANGAALAFMSFEVDDPTGYGRVLRDDAGKVCEIREHRDLVTDAEKSVCEVNGGVYLGQTEALTGALGRLQPNNAQGEYYLTDIVASIAVTDVVRTCKTSAGVLQGVNDRAQLSQAEQVLFERVRQRLGKGGVSIVGAPLIDDTVAVGADARIEDGVRLRGKTKIGAGTTVDVGVVVDDCVIGDGATIKPHCVLTQSELGNAVQIGPFAHLRPDSVIEDTAKVGNFVETKKTRLRHGAKANHLTYLGDADVGERANLGAGTIVCNYNGFQKHKTVIGEGAFIGSDSQLIAPVTVGDGAYVATGTTVQRDVPDDALAIGRTRQQNKEGYARRLRARFKAEADRAKG